MEFVLSKPFVNKILQYNKILSSMELAVNQNSTQTGPTVQAYLNSSTVIRMEELGKCTVGRMHM